MKIPVKSILALFLLLGAAACKSDKNGSGEAYTTPPLTQENMSPEVAESIKRGAKIYNNYCASCHLTSGEGISNIFPPLNKSDWLTEKREESIRAIKYGLHGPIEVNGEEYDNLMPRLGLEDREIADVMNYTLNAWDNILRKPVSEEEVQGVTE